MCNTTNEFLKEFKTIKAKETNLKRKLTDKLINLSKLYPDVTIDTIQDIEIKASDVSIFIYNETDDLIKYLQIIENHIEKLNTKNQLSLFN